MLNVILQQVILASTYGSGAYNSGDYNGALIAIGPLVLPNTGAGWAVIIGAVLIALGGGAAVWLRRRRSTIA